MDAHFYYEINVRILRVPRKWTLSIKKLLKVDFCFLLKRCSDSRMFQTIQTRCLDFAACHDIFLIKVVFVLFIFFRGRLKLCEDFLSYRKFSVLYKTPCFFRLYTGHCIKKTNSFDHYERIISARKAKLYWDKCVRINT